MAKISVVLPVYNHANFIRPAIESILHQTWRDFELLIVDDGSTDHLDAILDSLASPRIRIIRQAHRGLPHALNTGFQLASGRFITWTSADNLMLPKCLERLHGHLSCRPSHGAIYADYVQIDRWGMRIQVWSKGAYDPTRMMNFGPAFLIRKRIADEAGSFDTRLMGVEDRDFSMRVARLAPVYWLQEVLYLYRVHEQSLSGFLGKHRSKRHKLWNRLREKWLRDLPQLQTTNWKNKRRTAVALPADGQAY